MSARTMLRLASRADIDLLHPTAADYNDWNWQAEHLAKENRFNGATSGVVYSVAQHIAIGATAILEETGDEKLAAYFALHDNAEAVLKDDTTPKKNAIAEIAQDRFGVLAPSVLASFNELTDRHDRAVHEAAGLVWPPADARKSMIKYWDVRMFVTEWRDLMGNSSHPDWERYKDVAPLTRTIKPFSHWEEAKTNLVVVWHRLLPVFQAARA